MIFFRLQPLKKRMPVPDTFSGYFSLHTAGGYSNRGLHRFFIANARMAG